MLSVIIPTRESERTLVRTLACLVPGATAGLIREVILADGGSTDETAEVGDVAGCRFLSLPGPLGPRLNSAIEAARSEWLMFLRAGGGPRTGLGSGRSAIHRARSRPIWRRRSASRHARMVRIRR